MGSKQHPVSRTKLSSDPTLKLAILDPTRGFSSVSQSDMNIRNRGDHVNFHSLQLPRDKILAHQDSIKENDPKNSSFAKPLLFAVF